MKLWKIIENYISFFIDFIIKYCDLYDGKFYSGILLFKYVTVLNN